ncbi:hypothetical protein FV141_03745 [Dermacoccus abyssi]|uniref:Uncharacterized protein n=1 Tax=Dermacoccus abyssi TaxID=322596 RepID=A0ABX5ZAE3_9MICO|nr:hypothetical protein FV141_03745 [Dermacoccus abyssi]
MHGLLGRERQVDLAQVDEVDVERSVRSGLLGDLRADLVSDAAGANAADDDGKDGLGHEVVSWI